MSPKLLPTLAFIFHKMSHGKDELYITEEQYQNHIFPLESYGIVGIGNFNFKRRNEYFTKHSI